MTAQIVFYDGNCGLCQRSIAVLSKWDKHHVLQFAPLNGETYKKFFAEESDMKTVVYFRSNKLFIRSDAIIEACRDIGGMFSAIVILKIIPLFIRDSIYKFIAGHRKKVSCVILTKDERFLN